jgi:hypothetical protein
LRDAASASAARTARIDGASAETRRAEEKISRRGSCGSGARSTVELGEQPDRESRVDEPDVRGEVGQLEAHIGLEPGGAAELLGPRAGGGPGGFEHPRLGAGRPQGSDGIGGFRRSRTPGEGDGVVGEHHAVEVGVDGTRMARILLREDEVVVAARDAHQPGLRIPLGHLDAQGGVARAEGCEGAGQQGVRGGLEHREAHGAGHLGERFGDGDLGVLELIEDADGLGHQDVPLRRELHAATDPTQQRHPDITLQRGELLRHGGLAVGQRIGHGGERAAA